MVKASQRPMRPVGAGKARTAFAPSLSRYSIRPQNRPAPSSASVPLPNSSTMSRERGVQLRKANLRTNRVSESDYSAVRSSSSRRDLLQIDHES